MYGYFNGCIEFRWDDIHGWSNVWQEAAIKRVINRQGVVQGSGMLCLKMEYHPLWVTFEEKRKSQNNEKI